MSGWDDDDMTVEEFDALLDAGEPVEMRIRQRPVSVVHQTFRIVGTACVEAREASPVSKSVPAHTVATHSSLSQLVVSVAR